MQGSSATSLALASNNIRDEGAKALASALQGSGVTSLDLRCNIIGADAWGEDACIRAAGLEGHLARSHVQLHRR